MGRQSSTGKSPPLCYWDPAPPAPAAVTRQEALYQRTDKSVGKRLIWPQVHLVTVHLISVFQGKCFSQWNRNGISNNSQGKCVTDNFSKETDIWDPWRAKTEAHGRAIYSQLIPKMLGIASPNRVLIFLIFMWAGFKNSNTYPLGMSPTTEIL